MAQSADLLEQQEKFLNNRLYSLDALRGFDMFWIMVAEVAAPLLEWLF